MKMNNFRGDLADVPAKKELLVRTFVTRYGLSNVLRCMDI